MVAPSPIHSHNCTVPPKVAYPTTGSETGAPSELTGREAEVLALLTRGFPNKSIARQLQISPKTVSNHVEHIYAKLGVSNRAGAAMLAMQQGLAGSGPLGES